MKKNNRKQDQIWIFYQEEIKKENVTNDDTPIVSPLLIDVVQKETSVTIYFHFVLKVQCHEIFHLFFHRPSY